MMDDHDYITTAAGVKMPRIIYGTAWKRERTEEMVLKAVQAGFRGIDTACQPKHYSEPQVGSALRKLLSQGIERSALFIQTKFTPLEGQDPKQIPYDPKAPLGLQLEQSFATSLKNLQTRYVDSLLLHSPLFPYSDLMEVWEAMQRVHAGGGASQLGISNCYDLVLLKRLYGDAQIKPAVVQNRFYADTGYDIELRRWCDEQGIIYQSFWSLTANPDILVSSSVRSLAKRYDRSPEQIFFRYLTQCGIVPLTGTTSHEHMKNDLAIFSFELSADALQTISALLTA